MFQISDGIVKLKHWIAFIAPDNQSGYNLKVCKYDVHLKPYEKITSARSYRVNNEHANWWLFMYKSLM